VHTHTHTHTHTTISLTHYLFSVIASNSNPLKIFTEQLLPFSLRLKQGQLHIDGTGAITASTVTFVNSTIAPVWK